MGEENKGSSERQVVIFALGNEEFGVNISEVREIIRMERITTIPNTMEYIKGVINLRGGIIVVIDLAMKLGFPSKESDNNTRIIVINVENNTVGMIVDSATEVLRLANGQIAPPPPAITQKIEANYIEGVGILGDRLLILLDLARVMQSKEMAKVKEIERKAETVIKAEASKAELEKQDAKEATAQAPVSNPPQAPPEGIAS
ncbi:chemotaxis protein CheW [Candidatus Woesearchaeota archaeon]|nr:chemotaxis protein CheW [Candidatus Woesearchaeota archaeon]